MTDRRDEEVGAYIIQVEPVSADGVQDPQQQVDLQGGVFEGDGLRRLRAEVRLQGVDHAGTHAICRPRREQGQRVALLLQRGWGRAPLLTVPQLVLLLGVARRRLGGSRLGAAPLPPHSVLAAVLVLSHWLIPAGCVGWGVDPLINSDYDIDNLFTN